MKKVKMSKEVENEIIKRAQSGDLEATQIIIDKYEKLILKIAHSLMFKSIEMEDLKQEGTIGLLEAIRRFDISKDFRFITFCYFWIYNKISLFTRKNANSVRPNANAINLAVKVKRYSTEYYERNNHYPTPEYLSSRFNVPLYSMREVMSLFADNLSLNSEVSQDLELEKMDYFYSKTIENKFHLNKERENKSAFLRDTLSDMSPFHRDIIEKSFGVNQKKHTHKQIARIYEISETEMMKLKEEILSNVRKNSKSIENHLAH